MQGLRGAVGAAGLRVGWGAQWGEGDALEDEQTSDTDTQALRVSHNGSSSSPGGAGEVGPAVNNNPLGGLRQQGTTTNNLSWWQLVASNW